MAEGDARLVDSTSGAAFEDGDDRGRVLIAGADTGGAYSLMELTVAPRGGGGFGPHRHGAVDEVFVVRRGALELLLDHAIKTVRAGDVVRVPAGTRHGYRNISGEPVELLVWFSPGGFEQLFLRYRTDQTDVDEAGFVRDATAQFDSTFEVEP